MTPFAALANEDIAVADNGGMPSIEGGGARSVVSAVPLVPGGKGSPPAVTGSVAARAARRPSGVSAPLSSGVLTVVGMAESALTASADVAEITSVGTYFGFLLGPGPSTPSSAPTSEAA